ncbi:MAG: hypothetical protein ABI742_06885 [Gemmatimonadota bacterium]
MPTSVRLKLECVPRVLGYFRRHPELLCAAAQKAVGRLERLAERTRALFGIKLRAQGELSAATAERDGCAGPLLELLAQVVGLARAAALHEGDAELGAALRFGSLTRLIPLERARAALDTALRSAELLNRYGMPEGMLEELGDVLGRYAAAAERRAAAIEAIAAANAELELLAQEGLLVIRHLDALNRIRLAGHPEKRAEWREARSVRWGKSGAGKATEVEGASPTSQGV